MKMDDNNNKRLFFACQVYAPWPIEYPKGRLVNAESRHLTLAFLGKIYYPHLRDILSEFPPIPFRVGLTGWFNRCLFLPERHPHVVSWHVEWDRMEQLCNLQKSIVTWLVDRGYAVDMRPLLSHVTIAREPFQSATWQEKFIPLPVLMSSISLFESVGNLIYRPIWDFPLLLPFEELSHTADIAFIVRAESWKSLYANALTALAFKEPALLHYVDANIKSIYDINNLDDVIIALNQWITRCDSEESCGLKAVSFHSNLKEEEGILQWEMIVDV